MRVTYHPSRDGHAPIVAPSSSAAIKPESFKLAVTCADIKGLGRWIASKARRC